MVVRISEWEVQSDILKCSNELMDKGIDPLELAAAHITHAMRMYRTILPQKDYDAMIKTIYDTRNKIDRIQKPVLH